MEENARIIFKLFWLSPPTDPVIADAQINISINLLFRK
jgi:hypothetical protein